MLKVCLSNLFSFFPFGETFPKNSHQGKPTFKDPTLGGRGGSLSRGPPLPHFRGGMTPTLKLGGGQGVIKDGFPSERGGSVQDLSTLSIPLSLGSEWQAKGLNGTPGGQGGTPRFVCRSGCRVPPSNPVVRGGIEAKNTTNPNPYTTAPNNNKPPPTPSTVVVPRNKGQRYSVGPSRVDREPS
jgi:hypothetical protein